MSNSFEFGRRRRENVQFFSPVANKSNASYLSLKHNDSTPTSSRTDSAADADTSSLIETIISKDMDSFSELFSRIKNINTNQIVPGYPMTLLHYSVGCSDNDPTIVEALLMMGGDPNNMNIEEKMSPLHISALYDYDRVMSVLIDYGGDPKITNGDGENCFDIVKRNVEDELLEGCFTYLFPRSKDFRKSIGKCLGASKIVSPCNNARKQTDLHDSGSDGFYSCESQLIGEANSHCTQNERLHSIARRLCPMDYTSLMTEDESADATEDDDDEVRKKLTTIPEESGIASASSPLTPTFSAFTPSPMRPCRGIASMTAPIYVLTDDSMSLMSDTDQSYVNSTPPITPQPTKSDLEKLQERMKHLSIPVTPSTYNVISKFAESKSHMETLLTPKTGVRNFSPELQAGIQNINLIHEWGNLRVDFLQNATPTANTSKSFYNYLLLDPRIIKKANFSGDHLKAGVINNSEKFLKYLESVFYIGKAHGKRPLQHLVEAKQKYVELGRKCLKNGEKIDKILEIWRSGLGVIIVSVFHHSSEREANVNEASMIDAMGLVELSNIKRGSYTGTVAAGWPQKLKNQLGSLLLFNSFRSFVVSDPKQFYPSDF